MKLLFLGSPAVAVPFLEECVRQGHEIPLVITQPDREAGRGMALRPPAVKEAALRLGLPVRQPTKMSEVYEEAAACKADAAIVVAFGRMLKPRFLESTRLGALNVHFSVLPKYRGAAPVQWSLIRGEKKTGVTLFWIVEAMDAGPMQRRAQTPIGADESAPELFKRLIDLGVEELGAVLDDLAAGRVIREEQVGEPSFAPKITADIARVSFDFSADELHNRVRGLRAGPKAYLSLLLPHRKPQRLTILKTMREDPRATGTPGTLISVDETKGFLVQCSVGRCWIVQVQPEGKKPLHAVNFLNGVRLKVGDRLETVASSA